MKRREELLEQLAGEYVLGTLKGAARRRFEHWMMTSYRVRLEVWRWETQLEPLANEVNATPPPPRVWAAIGERLWSKPQVSSAPARAMPWRSLSIAATVLAVILGSLLALQLHRGQADQSLLAVIQNQKSQPLWVMNAHPVQQTFELKSVHATPAGPGKDYELWILPPDGKPVSVGLLPVDGNTLVIHLTDQQKQQLIRARALAISLEPTGGSPTGQPTGPVLYSTQMFNL